MKKITFAIALFLTLGLVLTSCNEAKKDEVKQGQEEVQEVEKEAGKIKEVAESEAHDHSEDMAMAMYQCPMKCEADKTYDKEGKCPKCNMDLKKVEKEESNDAEEAVETKEEKQEDQ